MQRLRISALTPRVHGHSRTWHSPAPGSEERGCWQRQVEDRSQCGSTGQSWIAQFSACLQLWPSLPAHHSHGCRAAKLMEKLAAVTVLSAPALSPTTSHGPAWDGGWAPLCQCYRVCPCQSTLIWDAWEVGFPFFFSQSNLGLLQCTGLWFIGDRWMSGFTEWCKLPSLPLSVPPAKVRSTQHCNRRAERDREKIRMLKEAG